MTPNNSSPAPISASSNAGFAAVFLDFENIYYFFKNTFFDPPELNDHILDMLRNLREKLAKDYGLDCIVLNAYADFERLDSAPQGALYLLGVDTKNVMGTDHKNAADMRLCIDVLETLYTRAEISTFILVAGDRDYIPVIQHLRRQARHVLGVGFRESVSGDLLLNLGEQQFLDARELLSPDTLERLEARRQEQEKLRQQAEDRLSEQAREISQRVRASQEISPEPSPAPAPVVPAKTTTDGKGPSEAPRPAPAPVPAPVPAYQMDYREREFEKIARVHDPDALRCLEIILERMKQLQQTRDATELWLGPFLRQLTDEMPMLAEFERRNALDWLARAGAIRVEKRPGDPHPFSVLLVNYQHPDVWALNP